MARLNPSKKARVRTDSCELDSVIRTASNPRREKKSRQLRIASLFSGIGGFELGLQRSGHEVLSFCDCDPAARAVLKRRFPAVSIYEDVRTLKELPKETELVTAGFPCEDLSPAGRTVGIFGEKSGLIWQVFRLLERRQPRWLLLENVPFMLNLAHGRAIRAIVDSLESLQYRWAYRVLDPRAFGLPQRRPRVFLLASHTGSPADVLFGTTPRFRAGERSQKESYGFYWTEGNRGIGWAINSVPALKGGSTLGIPSAPAIILPGRQVITPNIADAERLQGFPAHWTAPGALSGRIGHRWRLVGNAVNVRIAEWIGSKLISPSKYTDPTKRPIDADRWPTAAYCEDGHRFRGPIDEASSEQRFPSVNSFLRFPHRPLSRKASSGVLGRLRASTLNVPPILMDALERQVAGPR